MAKKIIKKEYSPFDDLKRQINYTGNFIDTCKYTIRNDELAECFEAIKILENYKDGKLLRLVKDVKYSLYKDLKFQMKQKGIGLNEIK